MGVFVVDYNGTTPGTLLLTGNRANNLKHTFHQSQNIWVPSQVIFWSENLSHVDIYAYYPYAALNSISSYSFEIQENQGKAQQAGTVVGYEASDFLWGKVENIAPTEKVIKVSLSHIMSCVKVILVEGDGFSAGEWDATGKSVVVLNTKREAIINLTNGNVTVKGNAQQSGIISLSNNKGEFLAIVAPQQIDKDTPIFSIKVGETENAYTNSDIITFSGGKQYEFTIKVHKDQDNNVAFDLVGWEESDIDYGGTVT